MSYTDIVNVSLLIKSPMRVLIVVTNVCITMHFEYYATYTAGSDIHIWDPTNEIKGVDTGASNQSTGIPNCKELYVGIVDQNHKYQLIIEAKPPKIIKSMFPKTKPNTKKYKSSFVEHVRKII